MQIDVYLPGIIIILINQNKSKEFDRKNKNWEFKQGAQTLYYITGH